MKTFLVKKDELCSAFLWGKEHKYLRELIDECVRKRTEYLVLKGLPINYQETLKAFGDVLTEKGDILLYPSKKTSSQFLEVFNGLVNAIAILAFCPGGVRIFGWHYEVSDEKKT